ncbi:MAG: adenylate kinase [Acidobacteriota bacterium]|nr:adenylate kinase [Acidobacteriota bacterium]
MDAEARKMVGNLRLVLLGPPGSGKGTQAERLAKTFQVSWISTGEMLRQAVVADGELGQRIAGILRSGNLVDDATMAEVVSERLTQPDVEAGFILDGFPRTISQADTLSRILREAGETLTCVLSIDVPEKELVKRILGRNRADDREIVIQNRLAVYREKTEPLIEYYKGFGLLQSINGDQPMDAVTEEMTAKLAVAV